MMLEELRKSAEKIALFAVLMLLAAVAAAFGLGMFPAQAQAQEPSVTVGAFTLSTTDVSGLVKNTDYRHAGTTLTITTEKPVTVSMSDAATETIEYTDANGDPQSVSNGTTTDNIVVNPGSGNTAHVTFDGVVIDRSGDGNPPAVQVSSGSMNLILEGSSVLKSGRNRAGLENNTQPLTISGEGALVAIGGFHGAGIGAAEWADCSNITIQGGVVTAIGGGDAAGIGTGYGWFRVSNIEIAGGVVTAVGGVNAAGIGGAKLCSDVEVRITGGRITARGEERAIGVGSDVSDGDSAIISISGGEFADGNADTNQVYGVTPIAGYVVKANDGESADQHPVRVVGKAGDFYVSGGRRDSDYKYESGTLTILSDKALTVSMSPQAQADISYEDAEGNPQTVKGTTVDRIVVDASGKAANVTFDGVAIDQSESSWSAAVLVSSGSLDLTLEGVNVLKSGEYRAGLQNDEYPLSVSGEGFLSATGGRGGAGIGGGYYGSGPNITVSGGTVVASGGRGSAGIGGGYYGSGSDITISGGAVIAVGNGWGAGIGGGGGGHGETSVKISGGVVSASGSEWAAGIGGGGHDTGSASVEISGGVVSASGGEQAAGIGGGYTARSEVRITISGGRITADARDGGAGIGGGASAQSTSDTSVTISGGWIAADGHDGGADIGDGTDRLGDPAVVSITGGLFGDKTADAVSNQQVYGVDVAESYAVAANTDEQTVSEYPYQVVGKAGDFYVSGGQHDSDYTYKDNVLTITSEAELAVSMSPQAKAKIDYTDDKGTSKSVDKGTTADRIVVDAGEDNTAHVTFDGVAIDQNDNNHSAAVLVSSGSLDLTLKNVNVLKSGNRSAGLQSDGQLLSISGEDDGFLSATGGWFGAGIGGGYEAYAAVSVEISGGTVVATGGASATSGAAGIGGGYKAYAPISVKISGGTVVATGKNGGAGIGGGNSVVTGIGGYSAPVSVEISGDAVITATGGWDGAGIGGGHSAQGSVAVVIEKGTVTANGGKYAAGIGGGGGGTASAPVSVEIADGTVVATGGSNAAGVGGGDTASSSTHVKISGGKVDANGDDGAAGVGGGNEAKGSVDVEISGGEITANGGKYAAGVGGGDEAEDLVAVVINRGEVTANGGAGAAGVGSGTYAAAVSVEVSGGMVIANGGTNAAGVGSGFQAGSVDVEISGGEVTANGDRYGAGIGGGNRAKGSVDVEISGGEVIANGGISAAGIGGGGKASAQVDVVISDGVVTATGGCIESEKNTGGGAGIGGGSDANGLIKVGISGGRITAAVRDASVAFIGDGAASQSSVEADVSITGGFFADETKNAVKDQLVYDREPDRGYLVYANDDADEALRSAYPLAVGRDPELKFNSDMSSKTYDGSQVSSDVASVSGASGTAGVAVSFQYRLADATGEDAWKNDLPTDAGSYEVKASTGTVVSCKDDVCVQWAAVTKTGKSFTIDQRPLTYQGVSVSGKEYDGTDVASASVESATLDNVLASDKGKVFLEVESASFENASAGENRPVMVVLKLTGDRSANYTLDSAATFSSAAAITQRDLTVKAKDIEVVYGADPVYSVEVVSGWVNGEGDSLSGVLLAALAYDCDYVKGSPVTEDGYTVMPRWETDAPEDLSNYTVSFESGTLTVVRAKGSLTLSPDTGQSAVYGDAGFKLVAESNSDGVVSFASDDESVATVDADGNVLIVGAGEATITAMLAETVNYTGAQESIVLTVSKSGDAFRLDTAAISKTYGDEEFALAPFASIGAGAITYSSSDEAVATIDGSGKVSIVGAGEATLTVSSEESDDFEAKRVEISLTVAPRPVVVEWASPSPGDDVSAVSSVFVFAYDGAAHAPVASVSNLVGDDECALTVSGAQANVGSHAATVTGVANANYTLEGGSNLSQGFSITPAVFSYTVEDQTLKAGSIVADLTAPDSGVGVTLPDGSVESVPGALAWYADAEHATLLDASHALRSSDGSPISLWWTFTPDSGNYTGTASGVVSVSVEPVSAESGVVVNPDGTVTLPDDKGVVTPGGDKPAVVNPDGSITLPKGGTFTPSTDLTGGETGVEVKVPEMSTIHPNGTVTDKDGSTVWAPVIDDPDDSDNPDDSDGDSKNPGDDGSNDKKSDERSEELSKSGVDVAMPFMAVMVLAVLGLAGAVLRRRF